MLNWNFPVRNSSWSTLLGFLQILAQDRFEILNILAYNMSFSAVLIFPQVSLTGHVMLYRIKTSFCPFLVLFPPKITILKIFVYQVFRTLDIEVACTGCLLTLRAHIANRSPHLLGPIETNLIRSVLVVFDIDNHHKVLNEKLST